jgi:NAD dependent epimerase/dehydratase family
VTGGAGFLGSHLCENLVNAGHEVLCVDNFYTGAKENLRGLLAALSLRSSGTILPSPSIWRSMKYSIWRVRPVLSITSMIPFKRPRQASMAQ